MDSDPLLSVDQAALRLGGLSKWTIYSWLSQGKLRRTKIGSRTMIRESELVRIIHEGELPIARTTIERGQSKEVCERPTTAKQARINKIPQRSSGDE